MRANFKKASELAVGDVVERPEGPGVVTDVATSHDGSQLVVALHVGGAGEVDLRCWANDLVQLVSREGTGSLLDDPTDRLR